jgi:hypothetical protein
MASPHIGGAGSLGHMALQGGARMPVLDEARVMFGYFLLVGLVLVSVYVNRIPVSTLAYFKNTLVQAFGLIAVIGITTIYGWVHGILSALALALVVSRALRNKTEGMSDYMIPTTVIIDDPDTTIIPKNHRWFGEKVLGENPFLIREKEVNTSAIQDSSNRSMSTSSVSR